MHENVDRFFGLLSWLKHQRSDRVANTHQRIRHYELSGRDELFPAPSRVAPLREGRKLQAFGMQVQTLVFPSTHAPLHPEEVPRYFRAHSALHRFRVRKVSVAGARPRRACIYLHPWMAEGAGVFDLGMSALLAKRLGCDVYNVEQVHHGRRRVRGSRYHGAHFFSADIARTVESLRQAVSDARALARYLDALPDYDEVGVVGVSLGGSVATICACVEPTFAWSVPVVAHIDIADAVKHAPIAATSRKHLRSFGVSLDELSRINEALLYDWLEPPRERMRLFMLAGRRDICMRAEAVQRQLQRWEGVHCEWVEGGHITSVFMLGRHLAKVRTHIDALPPRSKPKETVPPTSAHAS